MSRTRYFKAINVLLVFVALGFMLSGQLWPVILILAVVAMRLATSWINRDF
jgi:hypothetical protein